jgi:hypothetical protein
MAPLDVFTGGVPHMQYAPPDGVLATCFNRAEHGGVDALGLLLVVSLEQDA